MNKNKPIVVIFVSLLMTGLIPATVSGHPGNELDDHWLAAACSQVPIDGRIAGVISERDSGTAITSRPGRTLVLYCNVEADLFHNLIQIIAEDNSPNVEATVTVYQQNIDVPGPPTEIISVTTVDQAGVHATELFFDPPLEPNEFNHMYYLKIEVVRRTNDPIWVYSVSLRDVL